MIRSRPPTRRDRTADPAGTTQSFADGYRAPLTRLCPPQPSGELLPRPDLDAALRQALTSRRLTLLSAPAGYGKTTLLASIAHDPPLPTAWLTTHADDDDPMRLLRSLVAAVTSAGPDSPMPVIEFLGQVPAPEPARVIDRLVDEIAAVGGERLIVLDELESITEPSAYLVLERLIDLLPAGVHLAIGSRRDPPLPLARLRARNHLAEFRVQDLRLTSVEGSAFLAANGHRLTEGELGALHQRTEGWPAGYRLLASALDRMPETEDRSHFLEAFRRSGIHATEFLAADVLDRQDPDVQRFLLETSVLSELTRSGCRALTGRDDALEVLEDLHRRNLFVTRLDGDTYRYHALFRELLEAELEARFGDRLPDLHAKAASIHLPAEPGRAIDHLLRAGLLDEASRQIEEAGEALLRQGFIATLQRWLMAVPEAALEARPRLAYLRGAVRVEQGDLTTAVPLLRSAVDRLATADDAQWHGKAAASLAIVAVTLDDLERAGPLIEAALGLPVPPADRVALLVGRARLALLDRRWVQAENDLEAALQVARDNEGVDVLYALMYLHPTLPFLPRGLSIVEQACALVRSRLGDPLPAGPLRVLFDGQVAVSHLLRGRLEEALEACNDGLQLIQQLGVDAGASALTLAMTAIGVNMARDNEHVVEMLLQMFLHGATQAGLTDAQLPGIFYVFGRLRCQQGRIEEAHQFADRILGAVTEGKLPGAPVLHAMLSGLLLMADQQFDGAESILKDAVRLESERRVSLSIGSARPLLAHLYVASQRPREALEAFAPALDECERNGTPGLLLREGSLVVPLLRLAAERNAHPAFCLRLLRALGEDDVVLPVVVPGTAETLTRREVEVLALLASGKSNQGIADSLTISPHTVKRHVANVLAKLDVNSRTGAAARARELGIA